MSILIPATVTSIWILGITSILYKATQQYKNYTLIKRNKPLPNSKLPFISVIIPARNEEKNIELCVRSILAQDYPQNKYEVIVANDHSTDQTEKIARNLEKTHKNLKVFNVGKRNKEWTGKTYACHSASKLAKGKYLLFIDADTESNPDLLLKSISLAIEKNAGLLSLSPFQKIIGFWERVILPAEFFLYALTIGFGESDKIGEDISATGQFMLFNRKTYDAIKGHYNVRNIITEDIALAKEVTRKKHKAVFTDGFDLIKVRMYKDFPSLWEGLSKLKINVLGGITKTLFGSIIAFIMLWGALILPIWGFTKFVNPATIINTPNLIFALITIGSVVIFASSITATKKMNVPLVYGFFFPLGYLIGIFITLNALYQRYSKKTTWKGRTYHPDLIK